MFAKIAIRPRVAAPPSGLPKVGLRSGVLVNFVRWGSLGPTPNGAIRRNLGFDDGTVIIASKIYYLGESAFPSGRKIKVVDPAFSVGSAEKAGHRKNMAR